MDASCKKHPVVAVVGPTATGKTALGVALAQHFSGEVISCDSMQIYKGLDVGTAKVTPEETCGIPHHGVDILTPDKPFSVADFTAMAGRLEREISARGALPILVGGTGLYVQSFLNGVRFTEEKAPAGLREQLAAELAEKGGTAMYEELRQVDPESAARLHPADTKRILRALEVYLETGETISAHNAATRQLPPRYDAVWIGLQFADRADMKALIDRTVAQWLTIKNKEFYYIMTAAEESDTVMDCTLECFRGLAKCLEGSVERGVIYGKGVYGAGEIESKPAMREAYDMGRKV